MTSGLRAQLIELLNETHSAHAGAFSATDGVDDEWPLWYADAMHARFKSLIGAVCTRSELVYLLVMVEKERVAQAISAPWAECYADFFLQRYGAGLGDTAAAAAAPVAPVAPAAPAAAAPAAPAGA